MSARRDRRLATLLIVCAAVGAGGVLVETIATNGLPAASDASAARTNSESAGVMSNPAARRAHERFQRGVALLQTGHHDLAVAEFHEVLTVYPALPEAHANLGFALLGLDDPAAAADFFASAIELRPALHTAYYGLAHAEAAQGELKRAIAAMQTFAHLASAGDPFLPRAQTALTQWQADVRVPESAQ